MNREICCISTRDS